MKYPRKDNTTITQRFKDRRKWRVENRKRLQEQQERLGGIK